MQYDIFVRQDPERGFYYPVVRRTAHSVATDTVLSRGFFASPEYLALRAVGERLDGLIEADGFFQRGEKRHETQDFAAGFGLVAGRGEKRLHDSTLQRSR